MPEGKLLKVNDGSIENLPTSSSRCSYNSYGIIANVKGKTTFSFSNRDGTSVTASVRLNLFKEDGTFAYKTGTANYSLTNIDISGYLYMTMYVGGTGSETPKWFVS